jgi:predicted transcriptional regulator of viral defense system
MSIEDIKEHFDVSDEKLEKVLVYLEKKGLVKPCRAKKGIQLAKATYDGLNMVIHQNIISDFLIGRAMSVFLIKSI